MPCPISTTVHVYRDSPEFNRDRWFMLPLHILKSLYVCTYDLATDEEGDYAGNWKIDCAMLLTNHPDCVFIYI